MVGIDVEELASTSKKPTLLEILWDQGIPGFDLILPTTSLLEIMFKLNREYRKQQDGTILDRYMTGLPAVKESQIVQLFDPLTSPMCAAIATKIRLAGHEDLFDCLIASCAIAKNGVFMTEDDDLVKVLVENNIIRKDACIKWAMVVPLLRDTSA